MIQFVGDHRIIGAQQGFEKTGIGIKARGIKNGVVGAQKLRYFLLKLFVKRLGAADKPHGGQAVSPLLQTLL